MLVLIGRAAASLAKRGPLYAALTLAVIGIQAAVHYFWQTAWVFLACQLVVMSLASAVVYAAVQADVDEASNETVWGRALERGWAVIVVTFVQQFFLSVGQSFILFGGDILNRGFGVIVLIMGLTLFFSDIDAVVSDDDRWWALVPFALTNSIRAVWSGSTMLRVIGIFLASFLLQQLTEASKATFWAPVLLDALLLAPFGVLTVLVYFDAIGYESKRSCSE